MKTLRAWIVFVLLITLPLITSPVITLATPNHQDKALILSSLSLLKGGANGFELERQPTRAEGAVMLVRLLGQENQARQQNYRHPFRDVPAWASPYIGYMYQFSLTQGSSPSTFSPGEPLSAQAYTTFVLRALGYNDQAGDFDYNASLEKASQLGMLSAQQAAAIAAHTFIRDDMVNISYLTLTMNLKNQDKTLIEKLVYEDRAVSEASAQRNGLIDPGQEVFSQTSFANTASPDDNNQYNVSSSRDLQAALELAMLNLQPQITLGFTNYPGDPLEDFETVIDRTQSAIENNTGLINLISEWRYEGNAQRLKVSFAYRYTWTQLAQLNQKGDKIIDSLINNNQSDYEKEIILHDYIINNCRYDYENYQKGTIPETSRTAYGVLLKGRGVCQGYAEAMNILCRKAGLTSLVVKGDSRGESHAWNLVKVEGRYYHVDPTWDDPQFNDGRDALVYDYFNLSDDQIKLDHRWNRNDYPSCSSLQYNYHVYNHYYVENYTAFANYVSACIDRGEKNIDVRIANFNRADYGDLGSLVFPSKKVSYYHYSINEEQGIIKIFDLEYR